LKNWLLALQRGWLDGLGNCAAVVACTVASSRHCAAASAYTIFLTAAPFALQLSWLSCCTNLPPLTAQAAAVSANGLPLRCHRSLDTVLLLSLLLFPLPLLLSLLFPMNDRSLR
jgi:hypothetical protein